MAPTEPTSVEDITVPAEDDDTAVAPSGAMAPVTLPRDTPDTTEPTGRTRRRNRRSAPRRASGPDGDADAGLDDDGTDDDPVRGRAATVRRPGRRVVRIVRHIQLWSVFKVALLGGLVFYVIFLLAAGFGWSIANATGQVHHIEQFMRQIGFDNWNFNGAQLFRAVALGGAILLVAGSVLVTLGAAVVNLIAEATGGIRFTVIEVAGSEDDDEELDERNL